MRTSFEEQTLPDVPGQTDSNLKLFFSETSVTIRYELFFVTFFLPNYKTICK